MAGISDQAALKPENFFKYNGKELNHKEFSDGSGLDWYSYGMREYDPQIGRFFRVDPLATKFTYLTPYQYASNNPVTNIDLDGLEGVKYDQVIKDKNGKSKVVTNVDVDIYVGVGSGSNTYNKSDVAKIQSNLEKQYNGFKIKGKEVIFHFNMHTFNADKLSVTAEAKTLSKSTLVETSSPTGIKDSKTGNPIYRQSIMGVAIGLDSKMPQNEQGNTVVNGSSISTTAEDRGHTEAHEIGHFMLLGSPNNPSTVSEHTQAGGIFQYKIIDQNGNVIQNTENVNKGNIKEILNNIPDKKDDNE
jgi:RHS repeat-associated protein